MRKPLPSLVRATASVLGAGLVAVLALGAALAWLSPSHSTPPCLRHLSRIRTAILLYANDHGMARPDSLATLLRTQGLTPDDFLCHNDDATAARTAADFNDGPAHCSYVYVGDGTSLGRDDSEVLAAFDRPENHAPDGFNALFGDGTIAFITLRPGDATTLAIWADVRQQMARGDRPVRWRRPTTAPTSAASR